MTRRFDTGVKGDGIITKVNVTPIIDVALVLVIILLVWLLGGSKISCHESFWDKDKQVIEIKR